MDDWRDLCQGKNIFMPGKDSSCSLLAPLQGNVQWEGVTSREMRCQGGKYGGGKTMHAK